MIIGKGNMIYLNLVLLLCILVERFVVFFCYDSLYLIGGKSLKVKFIFCDILNRLFLWFFIYFNVYV